MMVLDVAMEAEGMVGRKNREPRPTPVFKGWTRSRELGMVIPKGKWGSRRASISEFPEALLTNASYLIS